MDHFLGQNYPAGPQRIQFLRDNCEKVESKGYMKSFEPDEILTMKDALSETAISINDIEEAKKVANDEFKDQIKPLKTQKSRLLKLIKNKAEFVEEECFKFVDFDQKVVAHFNAEGVNIEERPMRPDEGQRTINLKTGTNN